MQRPESFGKKRRSKLIIDAMKNGSMVIETNAIIVECNDALEKNVGVPGRFNWNAYIT